MYFSASCLSDYFSSLQQCLSGPETLNVHYKATTIILTIKWIYESHCESDMSSQTVHTDASTNVTKLLECCDILTGLLIFFLLFFHWNY